MKTWSLFRLQWEWVMP